jgi:hypothetical protein
VDRWRRVSQPNRVGWEKTKKGKQNDGILTSRRPCPRRSGGSDQPCGRDSEKARDDTSER